MRRIDTTIANRKRTKTPNNCRQNNTQKHEHWNTAKKKKKKKKKIGVLNSGVPRVEYSWYAILGNIFGIRASIIY
jgi:hypothetical protein